MPAYAIAELTVTNPEAYEEYRRLVPATVEAFGGTFRVRGGTAVLKEGAPEPGRIVVLEFKDMATLEAWYASPAYQEALAVRLANSVGRVVFVEGLPTA
ncbi:MAG: DUF1330 domain-containing protein [Alphaproteobacteria bacterium]|nr:DUF1330 domain-containing protein [Alphaproteobacteria bacterium]TAD87867.1 MAG: DUF1330 domain-containing protein [Alphaproteobacteria bacterium]